MAPPVKRQATTTNNKTTTTTMKHPQVAGRSELCVMKDYNVSQFLSNNKSGEHVTISHNNQSGN